MDPKNNKSGELERRISTRNSVRISITGADDDFDVAGLVSDGFRPTQSGLGLEPPSPSISAASSSSSTAHADRPETPSSLGDAPSRPSSVSKSHRPQESFALRHDGGMGPIEESSALTRTSSLSTESTAYMPSAESPYQGPSGPSHPYDLYPQNVRMARTMSMTTSSTEPVSESSYNGPRAPAHPYNLYPQDTIAESGAVAVAPIPLGFRGLPDRYQRRIGAEGEEIADIIGPDGHTEQLPPYTRYPDEAYARKVREAGEAPASTIGAVPTSPVAPTLQTSGLRAIPGAGGIGLATRNPEFESMDDLGSPQSRHSSRSFTSDASHHEINMAAAGISEKEEPAKPWQTWLKRRVCGIVPLWSIFLTAVVLLLMGIILGSVIGSFMVKQRRPPRKEGNQEPNASTASSTFDATPIPTPTDLPPLPTGNYSIPLMNSRQMNACFADTTLAQAWQCHLVIQGLRLTIDQTKKDSPGDYTAALTCNTSNTVANNIYSYGEQPFLIDKPATLELVNDTFDTGRGPAWFHMMAYNKTVIVPERALTVTNGPDGPRLRYRNDRADRDRKYPIGSTDFKRKGIISEGAKPWICNWPETYLEVFIYAQQNSSMGSFKPPPPPPPPLTTPPSSPPTPTPTASPPLDWTDGSKPYPGTNPTNWPTGHPEGAAPKTPEGPTPPESSPTPTETPSSSETYGPIDANDNFAQPPPPYPRVIKIEERHQHGRSRPSCTQVHIGEFGERAKPVKGPDGKPVIIEIEEAAPSPPEEREFHKRSFPWLAERADVGPANQCSCVWFLT